MNYGIDRRELLNSILCVSVEMALQPETPLLHDIMKPTNSNGYNIVPLDYNPKISNVEKGTTANTIFQ